MPSKKIKPSKSSIKRSNSVSKSLTSHVAFIPLVFLVLVVWVIYRSLFRFPIWFDETIGKAIFFGLPVWLYISLTRSKSMVDTFSLRKLFPGLFLGLAIGGIYGFSAVLATMIHAHVSVVQAPLFMSDEFWWQMFLALMTGFWETLFFYCWVMVIVTEKYVKWSLVNQLLMVTAIFLIFHLPNTLLRFTGVTVISQLVLLFFFGLGQALLFARYKNLYALALSQAIWGMVLVIYTR